MLIWDSMFLYIKKPKASISESFFVSSVFYVFKNLYYQIAIYSSYKFSLFRLFVYQNIQENSFSLETWRNERGINVKNDMYYLQVWWNNRSIPNQLRQLWLEIEFLRDTSKLLKSWKDSGSKEWHHLSRILLCKCMSVFGV